MLMLICLAENANKLLPKITISGVPVSILESVPSDGSIDKEKTRELEKNIIIEKIKEKNPSIADLVALDYLKAANLKTTSFTSAIEKLMQHMCNTKTKKSFDNCLKNDKSSWFSTHPSGAERLKYLTSESDM